MTLFFTNLIKYFPNKVEISSIQHGVHVNYSPIKAKTYDKQGVVLEVAATLLMRSCDLHNRRTVH